MTAAATTAAEQERDRVLDEVTVKHRRVLSPGMAVIEKWAATGREFSLNQIRDELTEVGVDGQSAPGALVRVALQTRRIRKVREEKSDDVGTHGKKIGVYVGTGAPLAAAREAVTIPVQRDRGGRFAAGADDCGTQPLFEVSA